ncbi:unnamed protein product [Aureobasidium mustum]|uniref:Uncharacterized protein n=1 Tax=Aureobasidium mustum TaxID=2773714 RepID=A0A9N8PD76_9PEZI|nr:unnamed protein product [Aureobasidium mustum]
MAAAEGRSLDLLERFQLAQTRAGSVPYITIIGLMTVTPADWFYVVRQIGRNINQLMRLHPILVASIDNTDIRRPKWRPNNDDPPFETHEILEGAALAITVSSVGEIAEVEAAEAQAFNIASGPLWRVGLYRMKHQLLDGYVALTIHHVVTDGMGALKLFEEVIRQPSSVPTTSSQPRQQPMPPKAHKTMRIQPSVINTVRKGARWILNHSSKATQRFGATSKWPPTNLLKDQPRRPGVSHISVDFSKDQNRIVERLEALGHQIGTVHSVLHTAAVVALAAAVSDGDKNAFDTIGTETPMSLRSDRKHPRIGGNYTGLVERSIPISKLKSETIASFTKAMNNYIHSREARSDARSRVGEFRLLPDRLIPDLWKDRLTKRGTSDNPFRNSLMISNLGRFEPRQPPLDKVWFCHASMPWDAAINMDVVSLAFKQASDVSGRREARLAVMISWLDGAIERRIIDRFSAALVRVVNLLAKAGGAPNLDRHAMRGRNLQDLVN